MASVETNAAAASSLKDQPPPLSNDDNRMSSGDSFRGLQEIEDDWVSRRRVTQKIRDSQRDKMNRLIRALAKSVKGAPPINPEDILAAQDDDDDDFDERDEEANNNENPKRRGTQQLRDSQRNKMHLLVQGLEESFTGPQENNNDAAPRERETKRESLAAAKVTFQQEDAAPAAASASASASPGNNQQQENRRGSRVVGNNLRFFPTKEGALAYESVERVQPVTFLGSGGGGRRVGSNGSLASLDSSSGGVVTGGRRISQTPFQRATSSAAVEAQRRVSQTPFQRATSAAAAAAATTRPGAFRAVPTASSSSSSDDPAARKVAAAANNNPPPPVKNPPNNPPTATEKTPTAPTVGGTFRAVTSMGSSSNPANDDEDAPSANSYDAKTAKEKGLKTTAPSDTAAPKSAGAVAVPGLNASQDRLRAPTDTYVPGNTRPMMGAFQAIMTMTTSNPAAAANDPANEKKVANDNNGKGLRTLAQSAGAVPVGGTNSLRDDDDDNNNHHQDDVIGGIQPLPQRQSAPAALAQPGAYSARPPPVWHGGGGGDLSASVQRDITAMTSNDQDSSNIMNHSSSSNNNNNSNEPDVERPPLRQSNREGLVEARQVLSEHFDVDEMQKAEEFDELSQKEAADRKKHPTWFRYAIAAAIVAVLSGIASAIVFGTQNNDATAEQVPTVSPSQAPTGEPSMAPSSPLHLLLLELPEYTLQSLQDFDTPQSKAFNWLSNHKHLSNMPEWKKMQLFALVTFYYSFEGENWNPFIQERWLDEDEDECFWFSNAYGFFNEEDVYTLRQHHPIRPCNEFVHCQPCDQEGRFIMIWVEALKLAGLQPKVPPEIVLLSNLLWLDVGRNDIEMDFNDLFPTELYNMTSLNALRIWKSPGVVGTIPTELFQMTQMTDLSFDRNSMTGTLATELGLMSGLVLLDLFENKFTGTVPTQLGLLKNASTLSLRNNALTGQVPVEMIRLVATKHDLDLRFDRNDFSGTLPSQLGLLTNITNLPVLGTGALPSQMGLLQKLTKLDLRSSGLTGTLPTELGLLSNVENFVLRDNFLSGSVPSQLGLLENATKLELLNNKFIGQAPTQLGLMPQVARYQLQQNFLTGTLQSELGLLDTVVSMNYQANFLTGTLPTELGLMTSMTYLSYRSNTLTGTIPSEVALLSDSKFLLLHDNAFSGTLPSQLGLFPQLGRLFLQDNLLSGPIATEIANLTALSILYLHNNTLTGQLPSELGTLESLKRLSIGSNSLTGQLPTQLGSVKSITQLQLENNQISGSFPEELWQLPNLEMLDLSNLPSLSGSIPLVINSTSLGYVDLRGTNLTGTIPEQLCYLLNETCTFGFSGCTLKFDCGDERRLCGCNCPCDGSNVTYPQLPPSGIQECESGCGVDDDCADGLLCASTKAHENALKDAGWDKKKAYCSNDQMGDEWWRSPVCYSPSKAYSYR